MDRRCLHRTHLAADQAVVFPNPGFDLDNCSHIDHDESTSHRTHAVAALESPFRYGFDTAGNDFALMSNRSPFHRGGP
jgi:hypothetical protein